MDVKSNLRLTARRNAMEQYAKKRGTLFANAFLDNEARYAVQYGSYPNEKVEYFKTFTKMSDFIKTIISPSNNLFRNIDMNNKTSFNSKLTKLMTIKGTTLERSVVSFGDFEIFRLS
jgi:hypothetical protein